MCSGFTGGLRVSMEMIMILVAIAVVFVTLVVFSLVYMACLIKRKRRHARTTETAVLWRSNKSQGGSENDGNISGVPN